MLRQSKHDAILRQKGDSMREWPSNWRELLDEMPACHRCGSHMMDKLYILSEWYPLIEICRPCSDDYHCHIKEFVEDIYEKQKERRT